MSAHATTSLEDSFISVHRKDPSGDSDPVHNIHGSHEDHQGTASAMESDAGAARTMDLTAPRRLELSARRPDMLRTLKTRLDEARFPDQIEAAGWSYGTESNTMKYLTREWLHHYDWEKELATLNQEYEHWTCEVNGLQIHYVRHDPWAELATEVDPETGEEEVLEGPYANPEATVNENGEIIMPLLLIHGWPGSWYEFGKAMQLLKKRGRYQIIVPSLPGFGWSQAPTKKRFGVREMAKTLHELMQKLGYKHYVAQGGDWGAIISRTIATLYPEHCLAIHINMLPCLPPRPWRRPFQFLKAIAGFALPKLVYRNNPREQASIEGLKVYAAEEGAYFFIQATKPQTLGYALEDSPVGLLSWLTEKYLSWADLDPLQPDSWPFTKTELLTQVMIYHSTQSITSSIRIYYEAVKTKDIDWMMKNSVPAKVPVGVGVWRKELFMVPKAWADDYMNIISWHEFPVGGHFAAFERPVEFEEEINGFFTREEVLDAFTAKRRGLKI
ncbi:epoxide hydrolase [Lunasporangiospora selenospora]|uniref:Epoxide hydrolase n=1 Tax=Lunasporangiospora selenospora TaxID=979761 RepID=A0A9P6KEG6_9FUNG|nr:epoxide hydrolase [Lunasporangiospora selenospora]